MTDAEARVFVDEQRTLIRRLIEDAERVLSLWDNDDLTARLPGAYKTSGAAFRQLFATLQTVRMKFNIP